jgi:EAL and modified HD-GYP domain-containing signal transduction protein
MTLSLVRTKFSESIAMICGLQKIKHEASMMGLFSTIDAMLDQTMTDALSDVSLPQSIKDSLIANEGVLMPIFRLVIAYEKGDWDLAAILTSAMKIDEAKLYDAYLEAVKWAREMVQMMYIKA